MISSSAPYHPHGRLSKRKRCGRKGSTPRRSNQKDKDNRRHYSSNQEAYPNTVRVASASNHGFSSSSHSFLVEPPILFHHQPRTPPHLLSQNGHDASFGGRLHHRQASASTWVCSPPDPYRVTSAPPVPPYYHPEARSYPMPNPSAFHGRRSAFSYHQPPVSLPPMVAIQQCHPPFPPPPPAHHHETYRYQCVGHPALRIYRLFLPKLLIYRLNGIIAHAEEYAQQLGPTGWRTHLYSLTKQDLAMRAIPGMAERIKPICDYVTDAIADLYGDGKCRPRVTMDGNQPHILKYSIRSGHTSVELHRDCCDVTANLLLCRTQEFDGGGTYFQEAQETVRLKQGEFLLHPGSLVHSGVELTRGRRYLMVLFAKLN